MLAQPAGSNLLDHPDWEGPAESTAALALGPGAQLGQHRIEAAMGAGGMGVVFRALDTGLHRFDRTHDQRGIDMPEGARRSCCRINSADSKRVFPALTRGSLEHSLCW